MQDWLHIRQNISISSGPNVPRSLAFLLAGMLLYLFYSAGFFAATHAPARSHECDRPIDDD